MIPHIAKTGWSFKGAAKYYLHDRDAQTDERVGWTYTHNVPTNDPNRAIKWMINTAQSAGHLKQQAGVAPTGRKLKSGMVYAYSLSWHPEQQPDKQTMLDAALETLNLLKLQEHEALVVNHTDTAHDHVHVVVNLIHPENGKKAVVSYDRLTMSAWAEELEKENGKVYCEQRVINNELRRENANENRQLALVKHQDKKLERAAQIQKLYTNTTNGMAFQSALDLAGYTLAEGNKGRHVIVDRHGEVYGLARRLEGQQAKHLRERFKDIKQLPDATELSKERSKPFDKEQYEIDRQKKIVDAAVEEEQHKGKQQQYKAQPKQQRQSKDKEAPQENTQPNPDTEHLQKLDAIRVWEQKAQAQRHKLETEQQSQYNRMQIENAIQELEHQISKRSLFGNKRAKQKELEALQKNLENIDQRTQEQNQALEQKIAKQHPDYLEQLKRQEEQYNQRMNQYLEQRSNNLDKDLDLGR